MRKLYEFKENMNGLVASFILSFVNHPFVIDSIYDLTGIKFKIFRNIAFPIAYTINMILNFISISGIVFTCVFGYKIIIYCIFRKHR